MASGMLGIGITGLLAYQRSLRTVSHNVSNAQTEGYSRQRVELGAQTPQFTGSQYLGTGVKVSNVERVYNGFITTQTQTYTASFNSASTYASYSSTVDDLLADAQVGLSPALNDYFKSVQDVSVDPTSTPARQAMLTQGETIVDRFRYLNQRFEEVRNQVNLQLEDVVEDINSFTQAIAEVNRNIFLSPGSGAPNDLLDERDRLLAQLSEQIGITTLEQDDGSVNVFVGKGQALVVGFDDRPLSVVRNEFDIAQKEVATGFGGSVPISDHVSGGKLGGLLDFRERVLDDAQNSLGALALGFASTMNDQHRLGQDLNGNLGGDLFSMATLDVKPELGVANPVVATLADPQQLTNDEYLLRNIDGAGSFELTRQSDGQVTAFNTGGGVYTSAVIDGFTLDFTAAGAAGDQYMVRPGRTGAQYVDTVIQDPREVAAALPIRSSRDIANTGNASIGENRVTDVTDLPLPGDVTLTYSAGGNEFVVTGAVPAVANIPYVSGATMSFNGLEVVVSGTPADTDVFTISNNTGGVGDNRNMLEMADMQSEGILENGASSYQEVYGQMVAEVGIKTRQALLSEEAQSSLMDQALSERDALSGVNLDEEAANLLKFQQAYQAAAQVISAANNMFQSLLSAVGR